MDAAVIKTALDALYAKLSLVQAGYEPTPVHCSEYSALLHQMANMVSSSAKDRRQTPLVNAGYAIRVSLISNILYTFINQRAKPFSSESSENRSSVNFLILGGGLDTLGCWLIYVAQNLNIYLRIYDVDGPENSSAKRHALSSMVSISVKDGIVYLDGSKTMHSYSIISADLTEISCLRNILLVTERFDSSLPTIALSELVLSYLGKQASYDLMKFISVEILKSPNSMFVAYEVLGDSTNIKSNSITTNFCEAYIKRYTTKLLKGKGSHSNSTCNDYNKIFSVLGGGTSEVERSLKTIFSNIAVLPSLVAARNCCSHIKSPELFDEHAALHLHLSCYAVFAGFSLAASIDSVKDIMTCWNGKQEASIHEVNITPINYSHHNDVRRLFEATYFDFISKNKSVRKMVKAVLNTDLCDKHIGRSNESRVSSILSTYIGWGGYFWVAHTSSSSTKNPTLIASVGVRCADETEHIRIRERLGSNCKLYEIQRLVVDDAYRGRKVASKLLSRIENWVLEQSDHSLNNSTDSQVFLVAMTLSILGEANKFYYSKGFHLEKEIESKDLVYCTYLKQL